MVEYLYTCDRCGIKQFGGKNKPPPQWYTDKDSERMQDEFLMVYKSAYVHLCPQCERERRLNNGNAVEPFTVKNH